MGHEFPLPLLLDWTLAPAFPGRDGTLAPAFPEFHGVCRNHAPAGGRTYSVNPQSVARECVPAVGFPVSEKPKVLVEKDIAFGDSGRDSRGGDVAAANVHTAPQGVRTVERAAGVASSSGSRLRSALRAGNRVGSYHLLKRAWADEEDEPADVCTLAETWSSRRGQMRVGFDEKVSTHYVHAYAEIYGQHPRSFVFAHDGSKIHIVATLPLEKRTKYPTKHSLSLCEYEPPFTDSTHRRSMNVGSIDHHVSTSYLAESYDVARVNIRGLPQ